MNAIVSWVIAVTPPLASLRGKRLGLFLLGMVLIGLVVTGFMRPAKTASDPALSAERSEASPTLAPHTPEPGTNQVPIALSRPLPPTAIPVTLPATQDTLVLEHSKKLAALDTVVSQVRADMAGMASRLDGFQTELHGIKQQLAQQPLVLTMPTHNRRHSRPDVVKVRQRRQRAKVNSHTASSPRAFSTPGLQVVAVNNWGTESRIIVREQDSKQYRQLRLGDPLSGGTIVDMNARHITIKNANGIATVDLGKGRP